jgi:hypothetical protein
MTTWQGNWEGQWSIAACEGKISQTDLTTCIDRIGGTDCMSLADVINTLLNICSAARVCSAGAPADAGSD